MNHNDLLFTNKFIDILDQTDVPEKTKKSFANLIENDKKDITQNKTETRKIPKRTIVAIDSRDRDINKNPYQNDIDVFLGKTFYNVKQIKLVSTEIPNSDQVITESPIELKNNLIAWQNQEDVDLNTYTQRPFNTVFQDTIDIEISNHGSEIGKKIEIRLFNSKLDSENIISGIIDGKIEATVIDKDILRIKFIGGISPGTVSVYLGYPIYAINIKPGNYTASTLAVEIENSMNSVKRRNGTGQFHYFQVTVNLDTDIYSIDSVITTNLKNNPVSTTSASNIITVNALGHGFKTGDRVKMIGVNNVAGIPSNILRGDFIVTVLDFNTFTYEITTKAIDTVDGGGNVCQTGRDAPFRMLFKTQNTRLQFNTGYPDEDSSVLIPKKDPITTKILTIQNAEIIPDYIRITTTTPHELYQTNKIQISNISTSNPVRITTSIPHGLEIPSRVTIRNTNSFPRINGNYFATPVGFFDFVLLGQKVDIQGDAGEVLHGGDRILISNLRTVPTLSGNSFFFNELNVNPYQFDIKFDASIIDPGSIQGSVVNTSQITVNHPNHNFNTIVSIQNSIEPSNSHIYINCKTFLFFNLVGSITEEVESIRGPLQTNTIDILLTGHDLNTSDFITITDSTSVPVINGVYAVQVVDVDTLRINFIHADFIPGTATVITGDKINITESNSFPRVDGQYPIHNKLRINSISTGTVTSNITTHSPNTWAVGDTVEIYNSNSSPVLNGVFVIQNIINNTTFSINTPYDITSPGDAGTIVNKSRFKILTDTELTSPGTYGIIQKNQRISLYRIEPDRLKGDSIGGIMLSALNGVRRTILKLIDTDNYVLRIDDSYATGTVSAGGSSVYASSLNHGFRTIQSNTEDGNNTGKLYRAISLQGIDYMFLVSPGLDSVMNTSGISDVFAKVLLNEAPGNMCFNSFISVPKEFDYPVAKLDTIKLQFKTRDNFLFNFNDINYSLSLEITELVDQLQAVGMSSRSGTTEYTGSLPQERATTIQDLERTNKFGTLDTSSVPGAGIVRRPGGRSGFLSAQTKN